MTKVISLTILHYGLPYLEYALRSVVDVVDEAWVLYTPQPSHGSGVHGVCPDHPADLYEAARRGAGQKLHWYTGLWPYEGAHRDAIDELCPDADIVLTVDADEVWAEGLAAQALAFALTSEAGQFDVPFVHYWRSFYRAVLDDALLPVRIRHRRNDPAIRLSVPDPCGVVNHMGYALPTEYIAYKSPIHGHRAEWRPDWFETKWQPNAQTDVHPVIFNHWNPVAVDPDEWMPALMQQHPYAGLDVIP
jgi:hypothetical protein